MIRNTFAHLTSPQYQCRVRVEAAIIEDFSFWCTTRMPINWFLSLEECGTLELLGYVVIFQQYLATVRAQEIWIAKKN